MDRKTIRALADMHEQHARALDGMTPEQAAASEALLESASRGMSETDTDRFNIEMNLRCITDLMAAVEQLQARGTALAELDTPGGPTVRWRGVWASGETYAPGACVVDRDALWVAERRLQGVRPGGGAATGWRLALKSPDRRPLNGKAGT